MSNGADGQTDPTIAAGPDPNIGFGPAPSRSLPEATRPNPSDRVPDRIWVPAIGALALAIVFVVVLLVRAGGDVSLLVHAAPPWTSADDAPSSLTVQEEGEDFDGQFFYRLGVAPWSTDERVAGVEFDLPALRNARWGYGALAWVASGADTDLVPWALVGLNVAAMAAVGAVGGGLARSSGRHAAWGLLFALWPGFAYSLSMNTSELVASTFVLGGLLAARHRRWVPTAALLSAAAMTRDTTIVVAAGLAAAGAWTWLTSLTTGPGARSRAAADPSDSTPSDSTSNDSSTHSSTDSSTDSSNDSGGLALVATGAVAIVVFAMWQLLQRARFGELPLTSSGDNNLSAPLSGLVDQLGEVLPPSGSAEALRLVCMIGLVALTAAAAWAIRTTSASATATGVEASAAGPHPRPPAPTSLGEQAAWCLALGVVVVLNAYLWSGATAFMRATTEMGLLSTLVIVGARHRHAQRVALVSGVGLVGLWLLTVVAQLSKLG